VRIPLVRQPPKPQPDAESEPIVERVAGAVADALEGAVRAAVHATTRRLDEMPGARVRRLRRLARNPLPFLYEVHPEARHAFPRELGTMTIDVDDIAGTAVGPTGQRGMDFLPLRPFRSLNWQARWQRIRAAHEHLAILPPIDVVRYAGRCWVVDGHNRVAAALYNGQVQIDANVVDLGSGDGAGSRPSASLLATMQNHDELKAVLTRRTTHDAPREPSETSPGDAGPTPAGDDEPP
jgi:hypothetical protein